MTARPKGAEHIKTKIPLPPSLTGKAEKQIQTLHSYLFSLAQLLSIALDSESNQSQATLDYQSPRAIFNSIRRLICASTEIFDEFRQKLLPYLEEIFLSIHSFNAFSAELNDSRAELETSINFQFDNLRQELPQISQSGAWTIRKYGEMVELWGMADGQQQEYTLPVELTDAIVIPAGTVRGATLSLPTGSSAIYITGKEKA